jgi:hypothetical protein
VDNVLLGGIREGNSWPDIFLPLPDGSMLGGFQRKTTTLQMTLRYTFRQMTCSLLQTVPQQSPQVKRGQKDVIVISSDEEQKEECSMNRKKNNTEAEHDSADDFQVHMQTKDSFIAADCSSTFTSDETWT